MTFEEWEQYQDQMLRYYNVYLYDNGPYEEDEDESSEENDEWDEDNNDRVCLCDATDIRAGTCCCNHLGLESVIQKDTTGGSRLGERPFSLVKRYIIIFAEDNPPKDT